MGKAWIPLFGDKTKEELKKELADTEKKEAKLTEKKIQLRIAIAMMEHENSIQG